MNTDLDPFAPWDGVVEGFDLADRVLQLGNLPPEEGEWANPASLSRMGLDAMPWKMLRRFMAKVDPQDLGYKTECWMWTGGTHDKGYGRFWLGVAPDNKARVWAYSHRIAFEHWIGKPPPGYIIDHECNRKLCCNPTHLWPQTNNDNLRLADLRQPWTRRNQYSKE